MNLNLLLMLTLSLGLAIGAIGSIIGFKRKSNLLIFFSMFSLIFALFFLLDQLPNFADNISALGTIAVAVLAAVSIIENNRLNDLMRKESRDKEQRDRTETLLNEIKGWANSLNNKLLDLNKERLLTKDKTSSENSYIFYKYSELFFVEYGNCSYFQKSVKNNNDVSLNILTKVTKIEEDIMQLQLRLLLLGKDFDVLTSLFGTNEEKSWENKIIESNGILSQKADKLLAESLPDLLSEIGNFRPNRHN